MMIVSSAGTRDVLLIPSVNVDLERRFMKLDKKNTVSVEMPISTCSIYPANFFSVVLSRRKIALSCCTFNLRYCVGIKEGLEGHVELGNLLSLKQRIELNLRITNVKSLYDSFQDIQQKIETLASESEADTEKEQAYRDTFESNYYSVLAKAQCLIHEEDKKASGSSGSSGAGQTPSVKLPIISLPEFDGSFDHWLEYRDTFQSLVHKCPSISKIQKFHYLKSTLKGSAQLVVDSIEFCEDNYDTAWELLLNRYDNSKLLVQKHVKSLFTMPSITKESSPQIRNLLM
ncbi:hypothetical protein NE865_02361 [Phthorimaea operculella]|nr:hypothetical protein NE865_02361 [Phthorimaea operculella]